MRGIPDLIAETPLLLEAIENNAISSLHDALIGLFNLRQELQNTVLQDADSSSVQNELYMLEDLMGRVIVYLSEWNGIHTVSGKLMLRGVISSRGDVLRLAAPIYDRMDVERYPPANVPILGVVGPIAGGKGSVGEIISGTYNSYHLPLSDRLREVAVAKGDFSLSNRAALRDINNELKPRFGNPVFVRWTIEMSKRLAAIYQKTAMTFDGFRSIEEAQLFKDRGGKLIGVTASADTRFERLKERNRGNDDFSRDIFDQSDELERQWIEPIMDNTDIVISNEGTLGELKESILKYSATVLPVSARRS